MSDDTATGDDMKKLLQQQNTHDEPDAKPADNNNDEQEG